MNSVDGRVSSDRIPTGAGSRVARVPVFLLAAAAAAAAVLGHRIAYALAIPSLGAREALLARTGHAYLPGATEIVVLAALAGLGGLFLHSVSRRDVGVAHRGSVFRRLAVVQVSIFASMEIVERLASGAPVSGVLDHELLAIGIGVQLLLAFAGAAIFALVYRAAEAAAEVATSPLVVRRGILAVSAPVSLLVAVSHRHSSPSRGPPTP